MTESSAVRWDQPRNQSPSKRRGGRRIEINPPNKISKTSIRNTKSRSSANPSAHTIVALKPSHWFEKGKTQQRQAQRRAWQTTASSNEHNFCGGAIVLVGDKIIDLRKPKEESIQQRHHHQIVQKIVNLPHSRKNQPGNRTKSSEGQKWNRKNQPGNQTESSEGQKWRGGAGKTSVGKCRGCWTTKGAEERQQRTN